MEGPSPDEATLNVNVCSSLTCRLFLYCGRTLAFGGISLRFAGNSVFLSLLQAAAFFIAFVFHDIDVFEDYDALTFDK